MTNEEIRELWFPKSAPLSPLEGGSINFRTVEDLNRVIKKSLHLLQGKYDLIVGIPRSGLTPGVLIALYLNLPFVPISDFMSNRFSALEFTMRKGDRHRHIQGNEKASVLIVDDSVNTGGAIKLVKDKIALSPHCQSHNIEYLAVFAADKNNPHVHHVLDKCIHPRIFEWNMMHHGLVESFVFDLDGILCIDGPIESSNDGGKYEKFISSVPPKMIPSGKIGAIVTSRLDKHRDITEEWLSKHGIKYSQLIMLNIPTAERRRELAIYGRYKADAYKMVGGRLFIESEEWQAKDIFRITNKPVFCLDTGLFLKP